MFEITGDDISLLSDENLRSVVGRLCEAELLRRGHSVSCVAWGGNQTAKDGGLDVHVSLPAGTEIQGFVPKPETGFQVKKSDMPRGAILDEMRPNGSVRSVIVELAKASGAYIIASAEGSTSFSALKARKDAMAEALAGISDASKLTLDFYDRNRLATWVRDHPGLIPWVRSLVGKSVPGWRSFGSWSRTPSDADDSYLSDDQARIKTGDKDDGEGLTAVEGINRIRAVLRAPGRAVRLVGLSGVGKTRLCEALFDAKVGADSLDPSLAVYTNVVDGPNPPPVGITSDLIARRTRAILVIDNCPSELHRRLADVALSTNSTISVITVEYDIRDDRPEGTEVFTLDSSSRPLIEKLIRSRRPDVSQIDAQTIAEISGGNARVALALAATVEKNESISELTDADLFKRLFQQRHEHDPNLLQIAQVCSLVYSFDGEKTCGPGAELPILAGLIGKPVQDVYAAVAEFKRRELLQERGEWRAVLPHAVANRLAVLALQDIPINSVKEALVKNAPARLRRSFSRRLGYLDESKQAREIVGEWLEPGGLLADVPNLDEDKQAMLANVAPVLPDATLAAIERTLEAADDATLGKSRWVTGLVRSLAYDPALFERAISQLVKLVRVGDGALDGEPINILASLFHIVLSGTHAPVSMRVRVMRGLLLSNDAQSRAMGIRALKAMLQTDHFSSSYGFEFGSRSRDYGYHPRTGKDVRGWFDAVMEVASPLALSNSPVAREIRKCIAGEFRGLWLNAGQADALENFAKKIAAEDFWREGWIATRRTMAAAGQEMSDALGKLTALEALLRPKDLVDQVNAVVLGTNSGMIDLEETVGNESVDFYTRAEREHATVENLGKDVANDDEAFKTLLPRLVLGGFRVPVFGEGLASADKPNEVWQALLTAFNATEWAETSVIRGFLSGTQRRDPDQANRLLDEALEDPSLGPRFVELQAAVTIDEAGVKRLHRALDIGMAPISQFAALSHGSASDSIPAAAFRDLMFAISSKEGGNDVALQILSMRLFSDRSHKQASPPEVREVGRALLASHEFHSPHGRAFQEDWELGRVAQVCLEDDDGRPIVKRIVRNMMDAINRRHIRAHDQDDLMNSLLLLHPFAVLDEMFSGDAKAQRDAVRAFADLMRFQRNPLDGVLDATLLEWCDRDSRVRYPLIASSVTLFRRPADDEPHQWTPIALQLLAKTPDPPAVFQAMAQRLHPTSWSGSLATKLESRLKLLEKLHLGDAPTLVELFNQARAALNSQIESERKRELEEDRSRSARFE